MNTKTEETEITTHAGLLLLQQAHNRTRRQIREVEGEISLLRSDLEHKETSLKRLRGDLPEIEAAVRRLGGTVTSMAEVPDRPGLIIEKD